MRNILREDSVTISITSSPGENERGQTKTVPYRHPNHGTKQLDQTMYSEQNQKVDIPKNTNVGAIHS